MDFHTTSAGPARQRTDCAIVGIYQARRLSADAAALDVASGKAVSAAISSGDIDGRPGATLLLGRLPGVSCKRVLLVGLGKKKEFGARQLRSANAAAAAALAKTGAASAISFLTRETVDGLDGYAVARLTAHDFDSAFYRFDELKSKKDKRPKLKKLGVAGADRNAATEMDRALKDAAAINAGVALARTLGNRPANVCTPAHLADTGRQLAKRYKSVTTKVLDRAAMKRHGMGAFLSVTAGADAPPQLIVMEYSGGGDDAPIALVGKGITFDTGGISIKPAAAMDEMKFDMCGAASVFGTMLALARMRLPINVVG
ncbi:MAG: leucyl aminopeptidase, partial [Gammaproteobacteria bacterium]|nr:leucyl aminopeptidase [Gammaproteobacteria bacterium]